MLRSILALAACGAAAGAFAQLAENPDWKEVDAPAPPPVRATGLIPIEVERATLRFAVDPASIAVGQDMVVRYVVTATSASGTVNALYEGIRCSTGEVKVYARHNPDSGWVPARGADWTNLRLAPAYHTAIARSGVCFGRAVPNGPPAQIIRDLRSGADLRFERGGVTRP